MCTCSTVTIPLSEYTQMKEKIAELEPLAQENTFRILTQHPCSFCGRKSTCIDYRGKDNFLVAIKNKYQEELSKVQSENQRLQLALDKAKPVVKKSLWDKLFDILD